MIGIVPDWLLLLLAISFGAIPGFWVGYFVGWSRRSCQDEDPPEVEGEWRILE